jgi:multiple antibiotic resistance protein
MRQVLTLFISTFSTLLAIINPLEALPVFLKLLEGKDANQHQWVARRSCLYAMLLVFFFFIFGTLILRIFGVSLSMLRIVGGIILLRIGFQLFSDRCLRPTEAGKKATSRSCRSRCRSCVVPVPSRQCLA